MRHQSPPHVPYGGWGAAPTTELQPFYINDNSVRVQVPSFQHAAALYALRLSPPPDIVFMHQEPSWRYASSQPPPPLFARRFYTQGIDLNIPPPNSAAMHGGSLPHDLAYVHQGGWTDFYSQPPHPHQETLDLNDDPRRGGGGAPWDLNYQIYSRDTLDLNIPPPDSADEEEDNSLVELLTSTIYGHDDDYEGVGRFELTYNVLALPAPFQTDDQGWTEPSNGLTEGEVSLLLETTAAEDGGGGGMCVVCQDDLFREDGRLGILCCRHRFHANCIGRWLQKKNICPLCNAVGINIG